MGKGKNTERWLLCYVPMMYLKVDDSCCTCLRSCYLDKSVHPLMYYKIGDQTPPRLTSSTLHVPTCPTHHIFLIFHAPIDSNYKPCDRILPIIFHTKYSSQVCNGMVDCPLSETGPGGEDEETCQEGI